MTAIKKCFYNLLCLAILTVLWMVCYQVPNALAAQLMNKPSPACQLTTLNGAPVDSLQDLKGQVLYVDFWASWCPPCVQSFPFMNQLHQEFVDRGLHIVGINLDENVGDAEKFLTDYPAEFTIVADLTKQCAKDFDVIAMPSSYLIDREGVVRYVHRGFRSGEMNELREVVELLLQYQP